MNATNPRISVVIPCYNEARFIGKTLKSLQQQEYGGDYEVIVVDNNCTDQTAAIARAHGARVVQEANPGVCWARQAGTEAARGQIVISTDADTVFKPSWLQTIDDTFARNKNCVAVTGPCAYSDGPWWGKVFPKLLFGTVSAVARLIKRPFYVTATNIAFKKSAWQEYNTALTQGGDELELLHDLIKQGRVIFNNKNPVYTSGRRLERGLFYNLVMSFLVYYMVGYYLNRLFNKPLLGMAPAYRTPVSPSRRHLVVAFRLALVLAVLAFVHLPGHDTMFQQVGESFSTVKSAIQEAV